MEEDTTTTDTTTDTTTEAPRSFIENDGTFKEGWQGAYLTEDQK